jgi:zinc transport system ATP-binding protein
VNRDGPGCRQCCTTIRDLGVRYGAAVALEDVSLHFHCGELTALVGPNGAGKTSLLQAILGAVPHTGVVEFMRRGTASKPRVGYLPQRVAFGADEPITALDLLAVSLGRLPAWLWTGGAVRARAIEALRLVGAEALLDRPLGALSVGQLQRVLLAVAMTPMPQLLLLDEGAAGMDAEGARIFLQLVCDLRRRHDVSILMVTHDVAAAAPHADRIVLINRRVLADGPPRQVLRDPALEQALGPGCRTLALAAADSAAFADKHDGPLA